MQTPSCCRTLKYHLLTAGMFSFRILSLIGPKFIGARKFAHAALSEGTTTSDYMSNRVALKGMYYDLYRLTDTQLVGILYLFIESARDVSFVCGLSLRYICNCVLNRIYTDNFKHIICQQLVSV